MTLDSPKDDPDWSMPMDEGHAEAVQYCVDEVKRYMSEHKIKGGKLEIVVKLTEECWGTVDVLLWSEDWMIVIDFKFGRGKSIEAEGNSQLMIYCLGALRYLNEEGHPIPRQAKLVILQPRIPNPTREWDTTPAEIKLWYKKSVKPAFAAALEDQAVCNPGEEQCQWCDANGVCTSRTNYLLGTAEEEFKAFVEVEGDVPMVPDVQSLAGDLRGKMETAVDLITPIIASKILAFQPDFDNFFKSVGKYAFESAIRGDIIPGYKLVYGKSNRKWDKPEAEIAKELKALELDPYNKKILSPAQAEKKLGKKRKDEVKYLWIKPTGKTILVDEHDTREGIEIVGETEMDEFTDETAAGSTPEEATVFEDDTSIDDIMDGFDDAPDPTPTDDEEVAVKDVVLASKMTAVIPNKRTKKYSLMTMGLKGGVSIQDAADELFNGDRGQVVKGLRNLNERDGFTIVYHGDKHFTVKT